MNQVIDVLKALYVMLYTFTFLWVWVAPAFVLFVSGQWVGSLFWLAMLGPVTGSIAGAIWPIYWYMILFY